MNYSDIISLLGDDAKTLLEHSSEKISKELIFAPGKNAHKLVFQDSDRPQKVKQNLDRLYKQGRLGDSGYLSIFPVDQGLEHSAAYSFYKNQLFFDPENIVKFAIEAESSAVVSSAGVLGMVSGKYARKIPFIVKLNHSEHLTKPPVTNQIPFSSVQRAYDMGAAGVGATIYFGSDLSHRQIEEVASAFDEAHSLGMFTVLWCYPRNDNYKKDNIDYATAVDITSQACHLGVTIGADLIKQKMPSNKHAFKELKFGKYTDDMYSALLTDNPIDLIRYQVAHCYFGRVGLVNSGGESTGENDLKDAVRDAIINKRGGGSGLIMGRKLFKRPWNEGLEIVRAVQDVYLMPEVTLA